MLDLGLLPALVSALGVVQDAGSYLEESVVRVGSWRLLGKYDGGGLLLCQGPLWIVKAPVHAYISRTLLSLLVSRVLVPRDRILERYLLLVESFPLRSDILRVFAIYFAKFDALGPLLVLHRLGLHSRLLLIEVVLHLVVALELGREHGALGPRLGVLGLARLLLHLHLPLILNHIIDSLEVVLGLLVEHVLLHGFFGRLLRLLLLHSRRINLNHRLSVELQYLDGRLLANPREHGHPALAARPRKRRMNQYFYLVGVQFLQRRRRTMLLCLVRSERWGLFTKLLCSS